MTTSSKESTPALDWVKFFEAYGDCPTTNGIPSATLEDIYQAFKARLAFDMKESQYGDRDP